MSSSKIPTPSTGRRRLLILLGSVAVVVVVALAVAVPIAVVNDSSDDQSKNESALVAGATAAPTILATTQPPTPAPTVPETNATTDEPSPTQEPTNPEEPTPTQEPTNPAVTTDSPTAPPTQPSTTAPGGVSFIPGENAFGAAGGVEYVHCQPAGQDLAHIVLLHGASFTKEIWLNPRRKIFENFCLDVSVTALDLSVSSGNQALRNVLTALQQAQVIQLPVVLVTPSASGRSMTDWMSNGDVQLVPNFVKSWVPVATASIISVSDDDVASIDGLVYVLAIYGNDEPAAGQYLKRLEELASATLLELIGGHAPYLKSPDEFVEEILVFEGIR